MPFASFKNIQKRFARLHKERSQPAARAKLGALPKKKDVQRRLRDEHAKRDKIREFKRKALTKNEDEFYFGMQNAALSEEKGHIPLNNQKDYSDQQLTDLLSHDLNYLRHELAVEMSKVRDLESRFHLLPADPAVTNRRLKPKRTVFVESIAEARAVKASFDASDVPTRISSNISPEDAEEIMNMQAGGYKELAERTKRAQMLKLAIRKREAKMCLMTNRDIRYKVVRKGNDNHAPLYKFEQKRLK